MDAAEPVTFSRATEATPTIYIVSDVRLYRDGLTWQLHGDKRLKILGSGSPDAASLLQLAALAPDVVAIDVGAAGALAFACQLRDRRVAVKPVAFAVSGQDSHLGDWARVGMRGFVEKEGSTEDIVASVLHAMRGELYCTPRFAALLLNQVVTEDSALVPRRPPGSPHASLTPRELEILHEINQGASNKEIARQLGISSATVKNHVHRVLEKLSVHRRAQATAVLNGAARLENRAV